MYRLTRVAKITIYNDDHHGRAIRIVRINPFSATISEAEVMEAGSDNREVVRQYHVRNGEMLVITTAEKDTAEMPAANPEGEP